MINPCIFFTSSNCFVQNLVLASSQLTFFTSGGACTACTNALLLQYNPAPIKALSNKSILMSGARPQYIGMG